MSLVVPTVGSEPGPTYASDINTSLTIIDQHSHTSGSGVPITPGAININSALTFANNFATNVAGVNLYAQSAPPSPVGTVYRSTNDLYFVDGLGNNIAITANGAVAGTPGSISNLVSPASAAYVAVSSTFVWQSNTGIAANLDAGSLLMRNLSPNSTFALTLSPPAAMGANYTITLPALPGATSFLTINTSGAISASPALLGALTTSNLSASAGILGSQLSASAAIVGTQLSASANILGSQLSASAAIAGTQLASGAALANIGASNITATYLASNLNLPGAAVQAGSKYIVGTNTTPYQNQGVVIIRGIVVSGAVTNGEGFSVTSHGATGTYGLTYSTAIADLATIQVTPTNVATGSPGSLIATVWSANTSSCIVYIYESTTGALTDANFSFFAVGSRA